MTTLHQLIHESAADQEQALAGLARPSLHRRARHSRAVRHVRIASGAALGAGALAAGTVLAFPGVLPHGAGSSVVTPGGSTTLTYQDSIALTRGGLNPTVAESSVLVDVYLDPLCPFCGEFGTTVQPELVAMEGVTVVYHPVAFMDSYSSDGSYSTRASSAIQEVAGGAPDRIHAFLQQLWAHQPAEGSTLTDEQLAQLAADAGVPADVTSLFALHRYADAVKEGSAAASDAGVVGVPYVLIDGEPFSPGVGSGWDTTVPAVEQAKADRGL